MVLRTVNAVCGKRKSVKTIIIGDTTNLTVDIKWFRKKYKGVVLKDKDYKWAYSRSKGCYFGGGGLKYFTKIVKFVQVWRGPQTTSWMGSYSSSGTFNFKEP